MTEPRTPDAPKLPRPGRDGIRLAVAGALFPALLLLAVAGGRGWVVHLDVAVADGLHRTVREAAAVADILSMVTSLGGSLVLYSVMGTAAIAALGHRRPRLAAFVVVTSLTGALLNYTLKALVGRPRPSFPDPVSVVSGPSFPSGHAMNSAIVFGAVAVALLALTARRSRATVAAALTTGLVIAIGFTRVALGVHYLSDVVAGWLLGLAWLAAGGAAFGLHRAGTQPGDSPLR